MRETRHLMQVSRGRTSRQAHRDTGGIIDDELTREGFDGRSTVFYRNEDPTKFRTTGRFRNTQFLSQALQASDSISADGTPQRVFFNSDGAIWISRRQESMPWFRRNVDGDECWFVHEGSGTFESEYGEFSFGAGDYVYIPKGATHRFLVDSPLLLFGLESFEELRTPKYDGVGRHGPIDPDVVRLPSLQEPVTELGEFVIKVKYDGEYSEVISEVHPFDVHGWKGDLFPFAFNIADWNVIMSDSLHLPPSMHVFLSSPGFHLINLLPRPSEKTPGTERVPWYHRNADYDEVVFVHGDSIFNSPAPPGLINHDPQGIHHGWSRETREAIQAAWEEYDRLEWKIIMVESRKPFRLDPAVEQLVAQTESSSLSGKESEK
ncbi:homogentisate 1,2-dioxygenase [Streptomyces pseudoechinosporeus]